MFQERITIHVIITNQKFAYCVIKLKSQVLSMRNDLRAETEVVVSFLMTLIT